MQACICTDVERKNDLMYMFIYYIYIKLISWISQYMDILDNMMEMESKYNTVLIIIPKNLAVTEC